MSTNGKKMTPTESRILRMLSDGAMHTEEELRSCLYDELSESSCIIRVHVCKLRRKLSSGLFIVRVSDGRSGAGYQMTRRINCAVE
jgi:DNA-binding response OmpR family regulator